ncbi:VCBS repeat-containing protein [Paenibacillus filicis]|uniref:VCBS repeat-containing protein n=1 Tax=Paenibacillus gyeongsangnamensis TaxID=3388067 RepID=A0ABT4Q870_9BACL|nr:VCBS repeat-containing protein [Paenibacillus filicis]MCZ8513065.1 VCBS repeat-containing protein [Paenibacillus filicis]
MGYLYHPFQWGALSRKLVLLDKKQGDVNGDGMLDNVYLIGNTEGSPGIFADHITIVIQDGKSNRNTTVQLQNNAGYNARLFLGDFDKDNTLDILVSINTGGSGGYGIFYIYSFKNNNLRELFNFEKYNQDYKFHVDYKDMYKVDVGSPTLDMLFTLDISYKGYDYLSQYYNENGKLKNPIKGEVLALGSLFPIVINERGMNYDLLALQRIIGTSNSDTLGYVVNLLTWHGTKFISSHLSVSIKGTKLITHF